jgi:hypothetical protein
MKKIFLLGLIAMIAFTSCTKSDDGNGGTTVGPQITNTTFATNHSAGSKIGGYKLDSGSIKIPVAGTSLSFNYDTVTKRGNWSDTFKTPLNTADFSTATYMTGVNQQLLGQNISLNQYFQVSSSSWLNLGNYMGTALNAPIPSIGSISVPVQAAKQNPALILVNFPVSYGDSIAQTSTNVVTAKVTASTVISGFPVNLNNESLTITQTTTVASKNICWGTLLLKDYMGPMQVVVQKYTTSIKTDLAFPNNPLYNAAISAFLSSGNLGITNGQVITQTSYRFWAAGKGLVMTLNADGTANVTTGL